ncbi:centromere protein U [Bufo gargarizans]|uniref:centromere protein U n=1 Tax=Bufo gargarizans TaxID=30331 RepID=UPI001CF54FDB|nr:centromere protein U [Bufo gargarizans]
MSTKKNKSKLINQMIKTPQKQNVRNQRPTSKADPENLIHSKVKELMNKKVRSPLLKEIVAHANIYSILSDAGDALPEDFEEDSFNPPLHSTAVYSCDDELLQSNENRVEIPAKHASPVPPEVQEKSMRPNQEQLKRKSAANAEHSDRRPVTAKQKRTPQKKAVHVPEPGPSKRLGTPRNVREGAQSSKQAPNSTPNRSLVSAKKTKTQRKETNSSSKKKSRKGEMEKAPVDIWSPENMPKSVKNVSELDVVLFESGKLIELYRENVETDVWQKSN